MRAVKENREYTISEESMDSFIKDGYDIKDDDGNIIAFGAGRTVPFEKYMRLMAAYEALETENAELRKKYTEFMAAYEALEAENAELRKKKSSRSKKEE